MSWASRVRDNALAHQGAAPALPWNPAATKIGHFRPHYSPAHSGGGAVSGHDAEGDGRRSQASSSEVTAASEERGRIMREERGGEVPNDPSISPSTAGEKLAATDDAGGHQAVCQGGHAASNTSRHLPPLGAASRLEQQHSHRQDSINASTITTTAGAVADAQSMDPFVAHERQVAIALQAVRRDLATFLRTSYARSMVVVPAAEDVVGAAATARALSNAESPTCDVGGKKPAKGKGGGPATPPALGGEHDAAAAMGLLVSQGLVSAHPRTMELRELQLVSERLSAVVSSGAVPRPGIPPDRGGEDGTSPHPHKSPLPTTKRKPHPNDAQPLQERCVSPPPMEVPDVVLQPLAAYAQQCQTMVAQRMRGVERLQGVLPPSDASPTPTLSDAADSNAAGAGGRCPAYVAPCALSKGLSLAAREVAHLVDGHHHHPPPKRLRRTSADELAPVDDGSEAVVPPACGSYLVERAVATFGHCDASQLSCYVIYGCHAPRDAAMLWCTRALMDGDDKALLAVAPKRVCVGVGWQRSAVHGAVTVCLATPWFDELRFTTQRSNMPLQEVARYITHGLTNGEERTAFPIKCLVPRYGLRAVGPSMHPIAPTTSATVQIMLDVPLSVSIACSVVQLDAPPQTPFHGRRAVDAEIKEARRRGKPSLKAVPLEPRYSTSSSLIDYPPETGALTRVTVRLVSHRPAAIHIFAKLAPHETSYTKAMSIDIRPAFGEEDWLADQGSGRGLDALGLPIATEVFHRWRGCLVQPMLDIVESGVPTLFEVFLPKGTQQCFIKGSHGQTTMVPVDAVGALPHAPSLTASTPSMAAEEGDTAVEDGGGRGNLSVEGQALTPHQQQGTPMASPLRRRGGGTVLFRAHVHNPKEGPLQLWADGYVLCHWSVVF